MKAITFVLVVVLAAAAGLVTTVGLGVACFHCGAEALPLLLGSGAVAAGVVGWSGVVLRRALFRSPSARRRTAAYVGGGWLGLIVALVLWSVLFDESGGHGDTAYDTAELAVPEAIEAGGRHRWPGTSIEVRTIDARNVEVERRWLGLSEYTLGVAREDDGWRVHGGHDGPGRFAQVVLGCAVPSLAAALAVARRIRGGVR